MLMSKTMLMVQHARLKISEGQKVLIACPSEARAQQVRDLLGVTANDSRIRVILISQIEEEVRQVRVPAHLDAFNLDNIFPKGARIQ